jgi:hypothetical protein
MTLTLYTGADSNEVAVVACASSHDQRKQRILAAIAIEGAPLPLVDDETLLRYFQYLSKNLSFPLTAHYPEPATPLEEVEYECTVLELLDPLKCAGDPFDGIFCKTRKAGFEMNLPLLELEISQDSPDFQMIEDYWYWFWNWRCP